MTILDHAVMANFTGTETWFRHGLARRILYTEGVRYVAETAGAYWLLDEVAFNQTRPKLRREPFQVWTLTRNKTGNGAMLRCADGNKAALFSKRIEYTDFPEPEITLWLTDNVILLPSEY